MFDGLGVPTVMGNEIFNSCNVWQILKFFFTIPGLSQRWSNVFYCKK